MDPNSEGPIYTAEQIKVPQELPQILKEFTKAAIRSQPPDLLQWSAAYFKSLSDGDVPPVKGRFEDVSSVDEGAATKGILQVLHTQHIMKVKVKVPNFGWFLSPDTCGKKVQEPSEIHPNECISRSKLMEKWIEAGCTEQTFADLVAIGGFEEEVQWKRFLALASSSIAKDLPGAMTLMCEILTTDSEGSASRIAYEDFVDLYKFLAGVDGRISDDQVHAVLEYLQSDPVPRFGGQVGPVDFLHTNCPSLMGAV